MSRKRIDVDDLIDLAPPPEFLFDRVPPDRWGEIERNLGTPLPGDYKLILTVYGSGIFHDMFWLLNPIALSEPANLLNQATKLVSDYDSELVCYERAKADFPYKHPFSSFPEPGGLLPLGGDTNGGSAFWLTEGPPDGWPLVIYPHGFTKVERHAMTLVEFLVRWLSRELPNCFFGVGNCFATDPIFINGL